MQNLQEEVKIKLPETIAAKGYAAHYATDVMSPYSCERRTPGVKDEVIEILY